MRNYIYIDNLSSHGGELRRTPCSLGLKSAGLETMAYIAVLRDPVHVSPD